MLKEVKKKRAYEDIVTQIKELITKGKLKQGDQLPNENELSETFKVSRSTVREAILSLETLNLVERRQGDGTYVMASSEEAIIQPLASHIFHEKDDLIDMFAVRKIVESEIAELASQNATPKDIRDLEKIVSMQELDLKAGGFTVKSDSNFHFALARMSKNKVLERLNVALVRLLRKTRDEYLQTAERKQKSLDGHRGILAAVKRKDGKEAKKAMRRHLEGIEKALLIKKEEGGEKKA
jgi:GntR family transcriptional regulator, transcriptional repressor for pyruvate dehydrogenase complex